MSDSALGLAALEAQFRAYRKATEDITARMAETADALLQVPRDQFRAEAEAHLPAVALAMAGVVAEVKVMAGETQRLSNALWMHEPPATAHTKE